MPLTNLALDKFVVQKISELSECDAPDLAEYWSDAQHWIHHFILNSIFRFPVEPKHKHYIFVIIRRAQMALFEYQNARIILLSYLDKNDEKNIDLYFLSLSYFEIVVTFLYQAYEFSLKYCKAINPAETKKLFEKDDGSPLERLNRIYNVSKHLQASTIPEENLHAVWISNKGLCTSEATISWTELAEILKDIISIANALSNPQPVNEASNSDIMLDKDSP